MIALPANVIPYAYKKVSKKGRKVSQKGLQLEQDIISIYTVVYILLDLDNPLTNQWYYKEKEEGSWKVKLA